MKTAARIALVAALGLMACRGGKDPHFVRAFHEAERAQTAGRYAEAATRFDEAAAKAPDPREKGHAAYLAAKMLQRSGDNAGASARFEAIARQDPPTEHTARALYDLADLRIAHGEPDKGYADLTSLVEKYPSSGLSTHALLRLAVHRDETAGKKDTIAWLDGLDPRLGKSELGETIAYQAALRAESTGDVQGAHARFLAIVDRWPYPYGNTFDDSLYRASEIDETLGRTEEAIAHLNRMLAERETAHLLGTYQRPRYTQAALRIATLYRDRLNDRRKAREAFHRVYADFTTSVYRDDALWQEAELYRLDGDTNTACARASTLVREFPDSRYVPCAEAKCPSVTRPSKSDAPKKCRDYLVRPRTPNAPNMRDATNVTGTD